MNARQKWRAAGKPERTDEEVAQVMEICKTCPFFQSLNNRLSLGRCTKCGCQLNLGRSLNKIRFATEGCPLHEPKWKAKIVQDKNGEWVEDPRWLMADEKKESRRDRRKRRQERKKRKEERAKRRERKAEERKLLGVEREPITPIAGTDPLKFYDRKSQTLHTYPFRDFLHSVPGAFLICGGPSVNKLDLTLLDDPRIFSMGVNNVAGHIRGIKAMTFSDPTEKFSGHVMLNPGIMKFVPVPKLKNQIRLKNPDDGKFYWGPYRLRDCPNVWGFQRKSEFKPSEFLDGEGAMWGGEFDSNRKILYTPYLAYRLLYHFGIRNIYLLGVDHIMKPEQGYAFGQGRTEGAATSNNKHYQIINEGMKQLRPFFEGKGLRVFNCNPDSHCPVWDYVPYETAVEACKQHLPEWPLDLSGFYEKPKVGTGKDREDDE